MRIQSTQLPIPETLPATGKSRFSQFKKFCPVSKEKFRQLSKQRRAPQPEKLGIRCTFYDNAELHKWLNDPVNYKAEE
ncbi:transcriptional regulator [Nitrosomonas sp.]|uniref:helix-turn-helix transcriptional regulator n=1 Tax=Nitrosomonas sp. TaxID=42353 RepID=UPI0025DA6386|nr:transcriptional regulator [Nitrosomonas sp.]